MINSELLFLGVKLLTGKWMQRFSIQLNATFNFSALHPGALALSQFPTTSSNLIHKKTQNRALNQPNPRKSEICQPNKLWHNPALSNLHQTRNSVQIKKSKLKCWIKSYNTKRANYNELSITETTFSIVKSNRKQGIKKKNRKRSAPSKVIAMIVEVRATDRRRATDDQGINSTNSIATVLDQRKEVRCL